MKTIKQLEKEIEELKHKVSENIGKVDKISISVWDDQIKWKEVQLQTLQEVCKEIKELDWDIKNIHYNGHKEVFEKGEVTCAVCKVLIDIECKIEELLKKFKGEE